MRRAEATGLDGFLLKPVSPSVLFDTIMQAFGKDEAKLFLTHHGAENTVGKVENLKVRRVLVVEDNEINRQVAQEILKEAGLAVSLANDGQEALKMITENRYDAVLMDIQMPVMDGYTATRKIRSLSVFKDLPIIAMTAHAMAGDHDKSLEIGMNDHVTKPIDPEKLLLTLNRWIQPDQEPLGEADGVEPEEKRKTAETGLPASPPAASKDLPQTLIGFDLEAGLRRLQGNRKLYRKLLIRFAKGYVDAAGDIRSALDRNDMTQAQHLVHTIKGLAGNLSALELQSASAQLEAAMKHAGQDQTNASNQIDRSFIAFQTTLAHALNAAGTLIPEDAAKTSGPPASDQTPLPNEIADEAAQRLREAAEIGDVAEITSIADEMTSRCDGFAPIRDRILSLADEFDFEGIFTVADQLRTTE